MKFTVIGPNGIDDAAFHLHAAGCADVSKRKYGRSEKYDIDATDVDAALKYWIDPELIEMGYTNDDVRVFACVKEAT